MESTVEKRNDFFNLKEISERANNGTISLPTVQRGFVWKPYQIENLWDSLLRGYPVGAFVLSEKTDSNNKYELLDGQQRASAICLGFYNPLDKTPNPVRHYLKTSTENIMIFIDHVKPSHNTDNRKFIFRVITKSHPWGYRQQENQKTLESEHIRKAMDCYGLEDKNYEYLKEPLAAFWPYDAYKPVPIGLFIDAAINKHSVDKLNESIEVWKAGRKLEVMKRKDAAVDFYKTEDIYHAVEEMLSAQKIPLLFLNMQKLYGIEEDNKLNTQNGLVVDPHQQNSAGSNNSENEDINQNNVNNQTIEDRSVDEVENLFIRLNSGGTPLRGEELNYSVLKSHISVNLQNDIGKACIGLFYPARFITIAFRLFNHFDGDGAQEKDSINMRIKPKQFQRNIREKRERFAKFIEDSLIRSDLIARTKEVLIYDKEKNPIGLPVFIVNRLADEAPEIMFMLLYRLLLKKDQIDLGLKKKVLGMVTLFSWFGKGEKQKDHGRLLQLIWPCVKDFDENRFWSNETIQRAMTLDDEYEILTPFPSSKVLVKIGKVFSKEMRIEKWESPEKWGADSVKFLHFIDKAFHNRNLILFAQRKFLFEYFGEIEECTLDDTNRAFDWDHISPYSAIRSKKNIYPALKKWYSSNGNFRAWPYSLNRQDQDDSPAKKLSVKDYLSKSSCDKEWLEINHDDITKNIKNNLIVKKITSCILRRNIALCKEWYEQLHIDDLIPSKPKAIDVKKLFACVLDSRMWKPEKEDSDRLAYSLSINDDLCLYFSFDIESETLNENNVYFGIHGKQKELQNVEFPKVHEEKYILESDNNYSYVGTWFTLISYSENSAITLFQDFYDWLENFSNANFKEKFCGSIKQKYKGKIIKKIT